MILRCSRQPTAETSHAACRMNLKDLASQLGVATSTVSRVLAGRGDEFRISAETQRRIREAATAHGVRPDSLARSLRLRTTRTVGLVVPDIANAFFAALAGAVERTARQHGYTVLLADSQESADIEAAAIRALLDHRVDGLILAPVGGPAAHLDEVVAQGLPCVQVDRIIQRLSIPAVKADNFGAARQAVRHLAQLGHRRIGCIQARADSSVIEERLAGYRAGMQEAGLPLAEAWVEGTEHSKESSRLGTLRLLDLSPRPTAILALSNLLALGVLEAARERGTHLPAELSLVAFDEQPWAALLSPPLATLEQPVELMGESAVTLLLAQLAQPPANAAAPPPCTCLPVRLLPRASAAALPTTSRKRRA